VLQVSSGRANVTPEALDEIAQRLEQFQEGLIAQIEGNRRFVEQLQTCWNDAQYADFKRFHDAFYERALQEAQARLPSMVRYLRDLAEAARLYLAVREGRGPTSSDPAAQEQFRLAADLPSPLFARDVARIGYDEVYFCGNCRRQQPASAGERCPECNRPTVTWRISDESEDDAMRKWNQVNGRR
jgi:hypothetical protein